MTPLYQKNKRNYYASWTRTVLIVMIMGISNVDILAQKKALNPVLPGFNPDPSVVRVGEDYFLATSSFEWFPGVPIYHSRNLVDWKHIGHALTRKSQLEMSGIMDADGIYAPMLTYRDGTYYMLYTVVESSKVWALSRYPNYLVTAKDPRGPWSEPYYINSLGFDPSLFIDDDGQAYILCRMFDHRLGNHPSPGIGMHAFDLKTMKPIGDPKIIYLDKPQTNEGPHIYKRNGYYYLFTAEGGTWYDHQEQVSRSKNIWGPYEQAKLPLITSKNDPKNRLQRAGHASLVNTKDGDWYIAYLASRRIDDRDLSPLGRETCVQEIVWENDWPVLASGGVSPTDLVAPAGGKRYMDQSSIVLQDDFDHSNIDQSYQFLREPYDSNWLSTEAKPGWLGLRGRAPISRENDQSMIAKRIIGFTGIAETKLNFDPTSFKHQAGLAVYYNTQAFYYLSMTHEEGIGNCLKIFASDSSHYYEPLGSDIISIGDSKEVSLRVEMLRADIQFSYSIDGEKWQKIGPKLDFGQLSDEKLKAYTGSMVALCAQDHMYESKWAYFDYFRYDPSETTIK